MAISLRDFCLAVYFSLTANAYRLGDVVVFENREPVTVA